MVIGLRENSRAMVDPSTLQCKRKEGSAQFRGIARSHSAATAKSCIEMDDTIGPTGLAQDPVATLIDRHADVAIADGCNCQSVESGRSGCSRLGSDTSQGSLELHGEESTECFVQLGEHTIVAPVAYDSLRKN